MRRQEVRPDDEGQAQQSLRDHDEGLCRKDVYKVGSHPVRRFFLQSCLKCIKHVLLSFLQTDSAFYKPSAASKRHGQGL